MTSERFARLKEILLAASDLSPNDRAAYLDSACADDAALRKEAESALAYHEEAPEILKTSGLEKILDGESSQDFFEEIPEDHPKAIGPYLITEVLGQGGMGVVYLARQEEPIRRNVALKLSKRSWADENAAARFDLERQSVALMDHPHIAKVLDAGSDDYGRPYFVMELVQGTPIVEYCQKNDLRPQARHRDRNHATKSRKPASSAGAHNSRLSLALGNEVHSLSHDIIPPVQRQPPQP